MVSNDRSSFGQKMTLFSATIKRSRGKWEQRLPPAHVCALNSLARLNRPNSSAKVVALQSARESRVTQLEKLRMLRRVTSLTQGSVLVSPVSRNEKGEEVTVGQKKTKQTYRHCWTRKHT